MGRAFIVIVGAGLCLTGCSPHAGMPSDFNRQDVHVVRDDGRVYEAYIDKGAAFGVAIGMTRKAARDAILKNKKIEFVDSTCELPNGYKKNERFIYENDPALVNCLTRRRTDYYVTQGTFATGWIHIHSTNEIVDKIDWDAAVSTNLL